MLNILKFIPGLGLFALMGVVFYALYTAAPVNFSAILLVAILLSAMAWALDHFFFKPKRQADEEPDQWLETPAGLFGVLLIVFVLRSFVVEPFRIPSSSMRPGLEVGDFILVNKFSYGIRLPVLEKKIIETGMPKRGDVVVFRYPVDGRTDFIKRLIGEPGDTVTYQNKRLTINGKAIEVKEDGVYNYIREDAKALESTERFTEALGESPHKIINTNILYNLPASQNKLAIEHCQVSGPDITCKVPPGHYFVMGDNRDNSADGRFWGFVPDDHMKGKAFFIWLNISDMMQLNFNRIFSVIK